MGFNTNCLYVVKNVDIWAPCLLLLEQRVKLASLRTNIGFSSLLYIVYTFLNCVVVVKSVNEAMLFSLCSDRENFGQCIEI